jgi:hypothetical protein
MRVLQDSSNLRCIWMLRLLHLLLLLLLLFMVVGSCLCMRLNCVTPVCPRSAILLTRLCSSTATACAVTDVLQMLEDRVAVVRQAQFEAPLWLAAVPLAPAGANYSCCCARASCCYNYDRQHAGLQGHNHVTARHTATFQSRFNDSDAKLNK